MKEKLCTEHLLKTARLILFSTTAVEVRPRYILSSTPAKQKVGGFLNAGMCERKSTGRHQWGRFSQYDEVISLLSDAY